MEWITNVIESMGYTGIFLLMLVEGLYPPIPSEVIMTLAGYSAAKGDLSFVGVVLSGTAGSVLGSIVIYFTFRSITLERTRSLIDKRGKYFFVSLTNFDKAALSFQRHSRKSVLFSRLVPCLRSLISIPAGLFKMKLLSFLLWTTVGSFMWTGALASLGYYVGSDISRIQSYYKMFGYLILGLILAIFINKARSFLLLRGGK